MVKIFIDNAVRDLTAEEQAEYDAMQVEANSVSAKLEKARFYRDLLLKDVRQLRNQKLQETDYLANSDLTMSDEWKAKRQSWRDIPANFNTSEKLDELLARDSEGKLTNSIWSKP